MMQTAAVAKSAFTNPKVERMKHINTKSEAVVADEASAGLSVGCRTAGMSEAAKNHCNVAMA